MSTKDYVNCLQTASIIYIKQQITFRKEQNTVLNCSFCQVKQFKTLVSSCFWLTLETNKYKIMFKVFYKTILTVVICSGKKKGIKSTNKHLDSGNIKPFKCDNIIVRLKI